MSHDTYLSAELIKSDKGKALLLQFILSELCDCADNDQKEDPLSLLFSIPTRSARFDWSYETGYLNKIDEHAKVMLCAFEEMVEEVNDFQTALKEVIIEIIDRKQYEEKLPCNDLMRMLSTLYAKITPFLIACKESLSLLLFLLKHDEQIKTFSNPDGLKVLMATMFPGGNFDSIREQYDLKGFVDELKEFNALITPYERH